MKGVALVGLPAWCQVARGCPLPGVPVALEAPGILLKVTLLCRCSHRDDRWSDDHHERERRDVDWNFHKDSFFCDVPGECRLLLGRPLGAVLAPGGGT